RPANRHIPRNRCKRAVTNSLKQVMPPTRFHNSTTLRSRRFSNLQEPQLKTHARLEINHRYRIIRLRKPQRLHNERLLRATNIRRNRTIILHQPRLPIGSRSSTDRVPLVTLSRILPNRLTHIRAELNPILAPAVLPRADPNAHPSSSNLNPSRPLRNEHPLLPTGVREPLAIPALVGSQLFCIRPTRRTRPPHIQSARHRHISKVSNHRISDSRGRRRHIYPRQAIVRMWHIRRRGHALKK